MIKRESSGYIHTTDMMNIVNVAIQIIEIVEVKMSCKSKKCVHYSDYFYWYTFRVGDVKNLYNLCDTDLMPGMPDPCSRCKRAYRDAFIGKVCRTPVSKHGVFISNIGLGL